MARREADGRRAAPSIDRQLTRSVRRHLLASLLVAVLLLGGFGGWAAMARISGAVVAPATVVVESNVRRIQHQEGGIVHEIAVQNGDRVAAGDLLVRLDDTVTRANLAVVTRQLVDLYAQEARLVAERDESEEIAFNERARELVDTEQLALVEDSQKSLMDARRKSVSGRKDQLGEQIVQYRRQIEGLDAQLSAKGEEIALIEDELKDLTALLEKRLVSRGRVTALQRDRTRLKGEHGGLLAKIAEVNEAISERRILMLQIDEQSRAEVLEQLQDTRARIARLEEQKIAAEDQLRRVEVRSPQAGTVHQLAVHTIGGVVGQGETLMLIVPQGDLLVIEAQVQPRDISQIVPGQEARVRFPGFDQRTTPELAARVQTISADLARDNVTGARYFVVRLVIPNEELSRLDGELLVPGMPAEAFITTEDRTVLSYLVRPVTDQIAHALRER